MENMLNKNNKKHIIPLLAIIFLSVITILFVCFRKHGYHIDEIYSYFLSNSYYHDKISNAPEMWNRWTTGSDFLKFITVNKGEQFAFDKVYLNNSTDAHPPLFYFLLHFVSSIFVGYFSKWYGLVINIFFLIGSEILIYKISQRLIKNEILVYLPLILYCFSAYAIDTCLFIRMYMMLTFFVLLYVYFNIKLFEQNFDYKNMIAIDIIIYLGAMTQYYFIVVAFFGTLFNSIYLLKRKRIKDMLLYGFGACISIVLVYLSFPYIITQVTGSSTNDIGNEIVNELFNYKLFIYMFISSLKQILVKFSFNKYFSVIVISLIILIYFINFKKAKISNKSELWILLITVFTYIFICYIGGHNVYLRYFYYLFPLFYILFVCAFGRIFNNTKLFAILCVVFTLLNSLYYVYSNKCEYIFNSNKEYNKVLKEHNEYFVAYNKEITSRVPISSLYEISLFDNVYLGTNRSEEDSIVIDLLKKHKEVVVYITSSNYYGDGFNSDLVLSNICSSTDSKTSLIKSDLFGQYYLIQPNK